jgi:site-specific DNA recombinase
VSLADCYDDGGYTGGNTERPGLQRRLADIEAGKIDCIVVYKVDRLSRSLLDFAGLMQAFETRKVSFVSVTQQFNTTSSMGRLILNVLLSFAQFEREFIGERTRDKIPATRRKGKWAGGHPVLGYDIDPKGFRLTVNPAEAERVRQIFGLYLEYASLLPVVQELARRKWPTKRWKTHKGAERGGKPFTRTSLYTMLTNVVYAGQVRYKSKVHAREHAAIVKPDVFRQVQETLRRNGRTGGGPVRNQFGALLNGLLRCVPCDCAMTPTHTSPDGKRRYRYYRCCSAQKKGKDACPSKSVAAGPLEVFVIERIRCIGRDPDLCRVVLAQARARDEAQIAALEMEANVLERELKLWHGDVRRLSLEMRPGGRERGVGPSSGRVARANHQSGGASPVGPREPRYGGRTTHSRRGRGSRTRRFRTCVGGVEPARTGPCDRHAGGTG